LEGIDLPPKRNYLKGSQVLFVGTKPQSDQITAHDVFQKRFRVTSSKGVMLLESYHEKWIGKLNATEEVPFVYPATGQPVNISDTTIPYVAIRLGGSSSFDGVLMLRDADEPNNKTFFWIEVSHVGNADD
jgi:capsule polysaccharide export protein KpsC/LpsZ